MSFPNYKKATSYTIKEVFLTLWEIWVSQHDKEETSHPIKGVYLHDKKRVFI